nr:hypothetical protein 5 [Campylobacterota bacterium]
MGQMLNSEGFRGMMKTVLDYLLDGNELDAMYAARTWDELNVRNKISILRSKGWNIRDRDSEGKRGNSHKIYWLDLRNPKFDE